MKPVSIVLNILVIVIALFLWIFTINYSEVVLQITIALALVSLLSFLIVNKNIPQFKGQCLRISYVFLAGFFIVFFQYNVDLAFHNITITNEVFASTSSICSSALLSVMGLSSFNIGNTIGLNIGLKQKERKRENDIPVISPEFLKIQKLLFIVFVILYLYYNTNIILSGGFVYNEETMAELAGSLSNYSVVMVQVLVFTILSCNAFIIKVAGMHISFWKYFKANGLFFNTMLILYLMFVFMTGDRGPILTTALAYSITYAVACERKISLVPLLAIMLGGGMVFSLIGDVRKQTNLLTVHEMISYNNSDESESFLPATQELAGSYNTFTYTVDRIPSTHTYFYGLMQLRNIGYSVPFLYRFIPFVYSSKEYENSSTSYCTYLIQGLNRTYGNGASLLADIYLDFGAVGIILIMIWLGFFVARLDYELFYGKSLYWMVVAVICFSYSIYLSRATLATPLYYIVPSLIIIYSRKFFAK